ncbi:RNA-directed DNA polymerase, eukaryota [Tanacetum coccineum]
MTNVCYQFSNNGNSLNKATKEATKKKAIKEATQDDDPSHPSSFTPKDDAAKEKEATQDDDPSHPSGFTPKDDAVKEKEEVAYSVNQFSNNGNSLNNGVSRVHSGVNQSFSLKSEGSISDVIVDVRGTWMSSSTKLMIVSVYAPQDLSEKKSLWEYITHIIDLWDGECIILGDFNEVKSEHERFGTIFNVSGAKAFNHFISASGLIDLPLEGYSYTWSIESASKMSKLDRFLVSEGLLMLFPSFFALCLERHLSDHRPIIMREVVADYGPSPF